MKVKIIIAFIFFVLVLSIFSLKTYAADITQTSSIKLNSELIDKSITDKDESTFIEIEIAKATYDMSAVTFADKTETYTGQEITITITGKLPEGVTVSYTNNALTNVGSTLATA